MPPSPSVSCLFMPPRPAHAVASARNTLCPICLANSCSALEIQLRAAFPVRRKGKEVPGAVPGILTCVLLHSHQGCSDKGKGCLHFANEETEAQRSEGPCPRSHSYQIAKPGLELGQQSSSLFKLLSLGEGVSPTFHPFTCPSPRVASVLSWFQPFASASLRLGAP